MCSNGRCTHLYAYANLRSVGKLVHATHVFGLKILLVDISACRNTCIPYGVDGVKRLCIYAY